MVTEDNLLIRRCSDGDTRAFDALVTKYEKVVFNTAFRMVHNRDDAADITQTVFLNIFKNLGSYNEQYKFYSWIFRITKNTTLNFLQQRKVIVPLDDACLTLENGGSDKMTETETSEIVQRAIMKLPPDDRLLIVLKYFQDLSYEDISFIVDVGEKTVKSRLYTARERLRSILITITGNELIS
ncbi:MAG: RNA polymerase sigma factor [Bacteroidota bacterium]